MHLREVHGVAILPGGVVTLRHVDYVVVYVLTHHVPWAAAESEAFSLAYGVEPVAAVFAEFAPGLEFYDGAWAFAEMSADEVVVVDFAEEAYALRVFAVGIWHAAFYGQFTYPAFWQIADGKHEVAQLAIGDTCQKVGLVFYGIDGGAEPHFSVVFHGGGVMAGGSAVEFVSPPLFEIAEFDDAVAHYVGVGRETSAHGIERVLHHVVPVFVVQGYDVERERVFTRYEAAHLDVFFGCAVA